VKILTKFPSPQLYDRSHKLIVILTLITILLILEDKESLVLLIKLKLLIVLSYRQLMLFFQLSPLCKWSAAWKLNSPPCSLIGCVVSFWIQNFVKYYELEKQKEKCQISTTEDKKRKATQTNRVTCGGVMTLQAKTFSWLTSHFAAKYHDLLIPFEATYQNRMSESSGCVFSRKQMLQFTPAMWCYVSTQLLFNLSLRAEL